MSSPIITEDDLKREIQGARCKQALRLADVPERVLGQFNADPLLFQFAHLVVFLEMPWQDAIRWILDHKAEIIQHAKVDLNEQGSKSGPKAD